MGFIYTNIKKALHEEIMNSGNPRLYLWYVRDALEEIEEEIEEEMEVSPPPPPPSPATPASPAASATAAAPLPAPVAARSHRSRTPT